MFKHEEKTKLYLFFTGFVLIQVFFLLFNQSVYGFGGLENILQYRNAKFSFEHPELLFGSNPFYTLLLVPFSQFGYLIAKTFNLLLAVFTLLLSARIVNKLFPGNELFTLILIAFSPVFFQLSASCLPGILFGFLLVAAIYLFIQNRYVFSAVVLSFIPLVDITGLMILIVFIVAFILNRTYRFIPYFFVGIVLYSIIGYFVSGDILWLIHKFSNFLEKPVNDNDNFYHSIKNSFSLFGIPLIILIITGVICWLAEILKNFSIRKTNTILFIAIAGSWISLFAVYTCLWWRNLADSEALIWKIAGIIPLATLTAIKAFEFISEKIKNKNILYGIFSVFALLQVLLLFTQNNLLLKADISEQLMKKGTNYIRFNEEGKKVFYFDPLIAHYLELDPFDSTQCSSVIADKQQPSNSMNWGDVLVWNTQISPEYAGLTIKNLKADPHLKILEAFRPFGKTAEQEENNQSVLIFKKSVSKNDSIVITNRYKRVLSFEDYLHERVKEIDGFKVWELDSIQEFSPTITLSPGVVKQYEYFNITVTLHYRALQPLNPAEVLLVFSAEDKDKNLRYEKADLVSDGLQWEQLQLNVKMPANIPASSKMLVYIWNKNRKHLLIENITVEIESS
jgi:hypothetical protein